MDKEKDKKPLSLEEQLDAIPELNKVMGDPKKRKELLNMSVDELRNLSETLFDGHTYHITDAYNFIEGATPNDVDSFVTQHISHRLDQNRAYQNPEGVDWIKWAPTIIMMGIGAAIVITLIRGGAF